MSEQQAALNTDREIWRESENGPSIHVTEGGGIGINVGGHVIVLPVREWFGVVAKTRTFALPVPAPAEPAITQRIPVLPRVILIHQKRQQIGQRWGRPMTNSGSRERSSTEVIMSAKFRFEPLTGYYQAECQFFEGRLPVIIEGFSIPALMNALAHALAARACK